MRNTAAPVARPNLDIENTSPPQTNNTYKNAMIATCATLATGLGTLGSLLLAGGIGQVGPFAVDRGNATQLIDTNNNDDKAFLGHTIPFCAFGVSALAAAALLSGLSINIAMTRN
jgi:hypothetical protein